MRDYPKYLNTKFDYEYVRQYFPREKWEASYRDLLADSRKWLKVRELEKEEDGKIDSTHKIIPNREMDKNGEEIIVYYQYEFKLDPNCKLLRLGMKVEDIEKALTIEGVVENAEI